MNNNEKADQVKKMLVERFEKDNVNAKDLDYTSWEFGFKRGMEYQQELDKRVLNLTENAGNIIKHIIGNTR